MAFCPNCGSEVQGQFCAKCGTNVAGAPVPMASAGIEENVASALCYIFGWLTGIIFLVWAPINQNRTVRFHAFQSIFLSLGIIALYALLMVFVAIVPFVGWLLGVMLLLLWPVSLCLFLFLAYKAYNRERLVLPIIGPLAEKQA